MTGLELTVLGAICDYGPYSYDKMKEAMRVSFGNCSWAEDEYLSRAFVNLVKRGEIAEHNGVYWATDKGYRAIEDAFMEAGGNK